MNGKEPFEKRKKNVSATLKVSLWFNNRHILGSYRGLNQSEIVKGGPPPPPQGRSHHFKSGGDGMSSVIPVFFFF